MERLVLATRNEGKARELAALLEGLASRMESLTEHQELSLPPEEASSYVENALAKARAVHEILGVAALGDDSGLEVDALDGAPGVRSARFAGPAADDVANNALLLERLRGIPPKRRTARFRCVLALVRETGSETIAQGTCEGTILESPRGQGGFGYDPLFLPQGASRTFAELPRETKDRVSHRSEAARALRAALSQEEKG